MRTQPPGLRRRPLALGGLLLVTACSGGSSGGAGTATTLSGVAVKGPMNGATVSVYAAQSDWTQGALLASANTSSDDTGAFTLDLPAAAPGPVIVAATKGSYTSGYDGQQVQAKTALTAFLASLPASNKVSITPASTLVAQRALRLAGDGLGAAAALAQANQELQTLYGLEHRPDEVLPSFDSGTLAADSERLALGLLIVNLDAFAHRVSPSDPEAAYDRLNQDFADGALDGRADASPLAYGATTMTGNQLKAALFVDLHVVVEAYAGGLTPRAARTWAAAHPQEALSAGVVPTPPGYSCSQGYVALTRDDGSVACWDGTKAADGTPVVGPHYVCDADGSVQVRESDCPASAGIDALHDSTVPATYTAPTPELFQAQEVHLLTPEELEAMRQMDLNAPLPDYLVPPAQPLSDEQKAALDQVYSSLQSFYLH